MRGVGKDVSCLQFRLLEQESHDVLVGCHDHHRGRQRWYGLHIRKEACAALEAFPSKGVPIVFLMLNLWLIIHRRHADVKV